MAQSWRMRFSGSTNGMQADGIARYSLFQGVLHIVGTLETGAQSVTLAFPGGSTHALPLSGAPPRIDARIATTADPVEVAQGTLLIIRADGTTQRLTHLGAALHDPAHALSAEFTRLLAERPPGEMLEVGSRARSGFVRRDVAPPGWGYSGFDIVAGPNVDVVGDAHQVSRHYAAGQFDAVMAFSVLEHLLMPWKFVIELNRVLKPGAIGLFTTHQTWPLHDEPWDFWRFSDRAWTALLNPATGFEILGAAMGEPAYIVAQRCSPETAFAEVPAGALASFVLFRKVGETRLEWPVELTDITATGYPVTGQTFTRP